jgi:hypothetical protein
VSDYLNSTRRSVAFFKKAHEEDRLQIKPPFQRNPVWTDLQKSFLIDSILRGYPIPELYVQDVVTATGDEQHIIVDGQQRVRACLEFVEGKFALHPDEVPQWPDMVFENLTPDERQRIFAYNFIVRQLPPVAEEELRAIFKRLNRNTVVLNQQELRHATYKGEFISAVETLADLEWWSTSGVFTPNDVRRMLDIEFVAELTVGVLHGPQNKKLTLETWFETYETSFPDKDKILGMFPKVLPDSPAAVWSGSSRQPCAAGRQRRNRRSSASPGSWRHSSSAMSSGLLARTRAESGSG